MTATPPAAKRFELIGKTKATIQDIDIQSLKMGQTDVKPAVCLTLKTPLPNAKLNMLDASLRAFLYENTGKSTGSLVGIDAVSDLPNLTAAAIALGALDWEYEQTGCKLVIYTGATGHADIKLKDGTVRKIKVDCKEGGTVDHYWQFYTADVDEETIGALGVLKSLERDIELTAPEIISQQRTLNDPSEDDGLGTRGPEEALADAEAKAKANKGAIAKNPDAAWPFPKSGTREGKSDKAKK